MMTGPLRHVFDFLWRLRPSLSAAGMCGMCDVGMMLAATSMADSSRVSNVESGQRCAKRVQS